MTRGPLVIVAGPTATGKTAFALALARRLDGELIGADSVQVYRGFDVGSAKPTQTELDGIPHHMIDVLNPDQDIDAMRYAALADEAISEVLSRGRLPIVVGGTGLWIRALLRGLVDLPPVDPALREALEIEFEADGGETLFAKLAAIDPITAESVHPNDAVRIIRALEVYAQTGQPLGELRRSHGLGGARYDAVFLVLEMERSAHDEAITQRVQTMLAAGWADEVRGLLSHWGAEVRAFGSVGYREMLAHVRDGVPIDETQRLIRKSTRTYARRQRTWFKSEPGVSWRHDGSAASIEDAVERVSRELRP
ncbi:MAG: tRNA (adenosine(37)-N6)-dimethylallyltransferase MiaA [Myxococcota bacterium]